MDVWRNARDTNAGTPTYGLLPLAVFTVKLESDSSQMSKSCVRRARKKISSGDNVMNTGSTPSICTAPLSSGRLRS